MIAAIAVEPILGVVLSAILIGVFWVVMFKPALETRAILKHGEPAEATILELSETGSSLKINGQVPRPGVTLKLAVRPQQGSSYETTLKTFISVLDVMKYQPGKVVQIKIDPNNRTRIALDE